jgi:molybdate transport system ATP-binding protein
LRHTSVPKAYIQTESATFRGRNGPVFTGCTLTIRPGERWGIVGPSGSGKGLLIAGLMGKLPVLAGSLGHPFWEDDPRYADSIFGVLPPGSMALASMKEHREWLLARDFHQRRWHGSLSDGTATVSELLQRSIVERRNPFAVLEPSEDGPYARVLEREIARFELGALLNRPIVALSNGELHRFVLARALLRRPRLLFIDDPFAGLDQHSRERLVAVVDELAADGTDVVIATGRDSDLPAHIDHVVQVAAHAIVAVQSRGRAWERGARTTRTTMSFSIPRLVGRELPAHVPVLEMNHVTVRHGDVILLDDVSLHVEPEEHWALLGPNGSGKSTLLSLVLADNPQVYANDVRVAGKVLGPGRSIWDQKAWLGWVSPELEAHYPPEVTTLEVVLSGFASSLGKYFATTPEQTIAAREWLTWLGLADESETPFARLAPAARRLALLARAAAPRPALFLFDEPCQGLDAAARSTVLAAVAAVVEGLAAAMIYVTHDPTEIPTTVKNVLRLDRGRASTLPGRRSGPSGST